MTRAYKTGILFLCLICFSACSRESKLLSTGPIPYDVDPPTPSQTELLSQSLLDFDSLTVIETIVDKKKKRSYSINGIPASGWAKKVFDNTGHKFRYTRFIKGLAVWQIGYFDNGVLDHDFHMEDGLNHGSQRMWKADGSPYINTYFKKGGIQHGKQLRWFKNGKLARDANFNNGQLISEYLYDTTGLLIDQKMFP